jgi:hypothetical protein
VTGPSAQFDSWSEKDLDFAAAREDRLVATRTTDALPGATAQRARRTRRTPSELRTGKPLRSVMGVTTLLVELLLLWQVLPSLPSVAELTDREPTSLEGNRLVVALLAIYVGLWVVTMIAMVTNSFLVKTTRWGWFWYSRVPFGTGSYWLVEPRPVWWSDDHRDSRSRRSGKHALGVFLGSYIGLPALMVCALIAKRNLAS